jgi:hypothetical protein
MWDSHVNGCQLAACVVVKAQVTPSRVNPDCTCRFSVIYALSSEFKKEWFPICPKIATVTVIRDKLIKAIKIRLRDEKTLVCTEWFFSFTF